MNFPSKSHFPTTCNHSSSQKSYVIELSQNLPCWLDYFVSWKFSLWLNEKERNELVPNLMSQEFVEWNLFEIFLDLAAQPSSSSWTLCNTKAEEFCKAKSRANNKFKNFFNIPRIPIYFRKGDSSVCNFQSLGFFK